MNSVHGHSHFDELDIGDPATVNYACADADYTLRLYHRFNAWFDRYLPRHRWIVEHCSLCGSTVFSNAMMAA